MNDNTKGDKLVAAKQQMKFQSSTQKGISLLELIFAILVVTTVIFMATRYVKVGQEGANVARAITQIRTVTEASYDWLRAQHNFCGQSNFAGNTCLNPAGQISMKKLVATKLLPSEYNNNDISPWRSELTVAPEGIDAIKITIQDVPETACLTLEGRLKSDKQNKTKVRCIMTDNRKGRFEGVF